MVTYFLLEKKFVEKLEQLPESGMGHHIVDITFKRIGILKRVTVLNCAIALIPDEFLKRLAENDTTAFPDDIVDVNLSS